MDPVELTARFASNGEITPLRFSWKGREYLIESTGRQWQAADGRHILIQTPGDRSFELLFSSEGRWFLSQSGQTRMAA